MDANGLRDRAGRKYQPYIHYALSDMNGHAGSDFMGTPLECLRYEAVF